MKILWLRNCDDFRVASHLFTPLRLALEDLAEVDVRTRLLAEPYGPTVGKVWMNNHPPPAPLIQHPREVDSYDVILLETGGLWHNEPWGHIHPKVAMLWGDNHREKIAAWMADAPRYVDLFLPILADSFQRLHPDVADVVEWESFPWWIDPQVFRRYGLPKIFDVLSTGSLDAGAYPVRTAAAAACQSIGAFQRVDRPPDQPEADRWPLENDYAKLLNSAKICLSCTGAWKYGLGKVYEVPAAFSVLASDHCPDMAAMGHVPGETFLEIDGPNAFDVVTAALEDTARLSQVAHAGHDLIQTTYTAQKRAMALAGLLEGLCGIS